MWFLTHITLTFYLHLGPPFPAPQWPQLQLGMGYGCHTGASLRQEPCRAQPGSGCVKRILIGKLDLACRDDSKTEREVRVRLGTQTRCCTWGQLRKFRIILPMAPKPPGKYRPALNLFSCNLLTRPGVLNHWATSDQFPVRI